MLPKRERDWSHCWTQIEPCWKEGGTHSRHSVVETHFLHPSPHFTQVVARVAEVAPTGLKVPSGQSEEQVLVFS